MFSLIRSSVLWNGVELIIETGRIARQAEMSVLVKYGNTTVLCTVTKSDKKSEDVSFFPLVINYQERFYSACKFPGGFVKREGKPSDRETLVSRLIDRPLRPLFPDDFFNEVQVICTVLSFDECCPPEIASVIGASAALCASSLPFDTPVAISRVGIDNVSGDFVLNAGADCCHNQDPMLNLYVAGTKNSILMVEADACELPGDKIVDAILYGHNGIKPVLDMIEDFVSKSRKDKPDYDGFGSERKALVDLIDNEYHDDLLGAICTTSKLKRRSCLESIKKNVVQKYCDSYCESVIDAGFKLCVSSIMREYVIKNKSRIDGRAPEEIRQIACDVDVLPVVHGSSLFTRGETQALVAVTLGSSSDSQVVDDIYGERKESFVLHYNFHQFAVGECGRLSAPSRREIGHGKLASRALRAVLPPKSVFPYSIRVVSEITESNGSSSMATVCGASMALMSSGVPMKSPVAGIAMGLIKDGDEYVVLSDIIGDEDALGDMDFKVAGTPNGITALQMDLKIDGINPDILRKAVGQAWTGVQRILGIMSNTISKNRDSVCDNAPRIENISIPKNKIRDLIGPGGKNIKEICDSTGAKIEIEDTGVISVYAATKQNLDSAIQKIRNICVSCDLGDLVDGTVVEITSFGAFISVGSKDGLLHISNIAEGCINKVEDVLSVGQIVKTKVIGTDERGRLKLSMRF